jgi:acetate kinase
MSGGPILVLNSGSSSLKFALFAAATPPQRLLTGQVERIGQEGAVLAVTAADGHKSRLPIAAADHAGAARALLAYLAGQPHPPPQAIGHRIVHGGARYVEPARVSADMLAELQRLCPYDPEHLPAELALIEACRAAYPALPQIACFDTAFHRTMPQVARLLPLPRRLQRDGVQRYGFHGLSYTFLLAELGRQAGADAARGRNIFLHLGSGASLAAVRDGACIDTSMGFTPTAGLVMGTRTGDLDPGLCHYLSRTQGMTSEQFHHMVNHQAGLLGVSETSADMRDLLAREATDPRAAEAVALFCYQARKWIGAYAAALAGLDTLVFSGGIGEHAAVVRTRICSGLEFLGVSLDQARNAAHAAVISADRSAVTVRVIATDEERVIAEAVHACLVGS